MDLPLPPAPDTSSEESPVPSFSRRLDEWNAMLSRGEVPSTTGRELLRLFGSKRRGRHVVAWIREQLSARTLVTEPDIDEVWVDVPLLVKRAQSVSVDTPQPQESTQTIGTIASGSVVDEPGKAVPAPVPPPLLKTKAFDPIRRISLLRAANKPVVSVPPNTSLVEATTIMMIRNFSQLPVIHNERDCKGIVTWQSIARETALGRKCKTVNDCMVPAAEVAWNVPLLEAIQKVIENEFALVRGPDKRFQGIVTVADVSIQFHALSEPFLLLEQIENLLRALIRACFTVEDLRTAKHEADTSRKVDDVSDLTFGEYVSLLEPHEAWPKLKVSFGRDAFIAKLKEVRNLRNDIMHFDPDPLDDDDITLLRTFAAFLEVVNR